MKKRKGEDFMPREDREDINGDAQEKKATNTAFILMFPALILAGIAVFYAPLYISLVAILLAIYQFLMVKRFILDFYAMRG